LDGEAVDAVFFADALIGDGRDLQLQPLAPVGAEEPLEVEAAEDAAGQVAAGAGGVGPPVLDEAADQPREGVIEGRDGRGHPGPSGGAGSVLEDGVQERQAVLVLADLTAGLELLAEEVTVVGGDPGDDHADAEAAEDQRADDAHDALLLLADPQVADAAEQEEVEDGDDDGVGVGLADHLAHEVLQGGGGRGEGGAAAAEAAGGRRAERRGEARTRAEGGRARTRTIAARRARGVRRDGAPGKG
ncbi:MAG: hypothetical protein ACK559_34120, partial [bacterium]